MDNAPGSTSASPAALSPPGWWRWRTWRVAVGSAGLAAAVAGSGLLSPRALATLRPGIERPTLLGSAPEGVEAEAHVPAPPPEPRIYSKTTHLWIRPYPGSRHWHGFLSLGESVRLIGDNVDESYAGKGHTESCRAWYAVAPLGYICTGKYATLDPDDPDLEKLAISRADGASPLPYRYAESFHTPIYSSLPSPAKQREREADLLPHLLRVASARKVSGDEALKAIHKHFVGRTFAPTGRPANRSKVSVPIARPGRVFFGSTLAYVDTFDWEGRSWARTWDQGLIPLDRIRPYEPSTFRGATIKAGARPPLAFVRKQDAAGLRREAEGFVPTDVTWPRLAQLHLTGKQERVPTMLYLETTQQHDGAALWVESKAVAQVSYFDAPPVAAAHLGLRKTWVDISITEGTLVAYEGAQPVYATLIAAGRGGPPVGRIPTVETASTPTGHFRILSKMITATMVSSTNSDLVHAEVPFTQNIGGPYALHAAYWHDGWGELKSGGCVNLSPNDAKFLFDWTEPRIHEGWHTMRSEQPLKATLVRIRR